LFSYVNRADNEVFLEAGELTDPLRAGDFWDTSLYKFLQCRFES